MRVGPPWLWVLSLELTRASSVLAAPAVDEQAAAPAVDETAENAEDAEDEVPAAVEGPATPATPAEAPATPAAPAAPAEGELPAHDAEIPRYEDAPPVLEPVLEGAEAGAAVFDEPPRSGHGRLVVGGILLGGGATLVGISSALISADTDLGAWIPGAVVGSAALVASLGLMIAGHVERERYRSWAELHGGREALPPPGTGLIAGGITCMAAGGFGSFLGGLSLTLQAEDDPPYGEVMLPLAASSVVTGVALLIVGVKRRRAYLHSYQERSEFELAPGLGLLLGARGRAAGLSLGLSGRF